MKVHMLAWEESYFGNFGQTNINNGSSGIKESSVTKWIYNSGYSFRLKLTFVNNSGKAIFDKNRTYNFKANNLYSQILMPLQSGSYAIIPCEQELVEARIVYADGNSDTVECTYGFNQLNNTFYLESVNLKPSRDVIRFEITLKQNLFTSNVGTSSDPAYGFSKPIDWEYGAFEGKPLIIDVSASSEESGILSGMLGWIQNLFNKVSSGFDNLITGISNVFQAIADLPSKIWQFIENGLKSLFVPDAEYITGYKDRWEQLLSEKLGAVYQVVNITFESWDRITASDQTNTINIPQVSIPLGNSSFSFGGQDVPIVPEGFDWLATTIKTLLGGLCTILFINGLRKRYDEIMGVEQ